MTTRKDHDTNRHDTNRHDTNHDTTQDMPPDMDRLVLRYLDALDRQDWDTFGEIWKRAETDAELERALREVHQAIIEDHNEGGDWDADAEAVADLAVLHFPERPPDTDEDLQGPLTAGDVAGRLAADLVSGTVRMTDADREANARLQGNATPLPERLKQSAIEQWSAALPVQAGGTYWRTFRETALQLAMARAQCQTRLAARSQSPPAQPSKSEPKPGPKSDPTSEEKKDEA
jgi:hypothetical protein